MDIAIAALVLIGSLVALAGQKSGPELKPIPIESEKDKKRKN